MRHFSAQHKVLNKLNPDELETGSILWITDFLELAYIINRLRISFLRTIVCVICNLGDTLVKNSVTSKVKLLREMLHQAKQSALPQDVILI